MNFHLVEQTGREVLLDELSLSLLIVPGLPGLPGNRSVKSLGGFLGFFPRLAADRARLLLDFGLDEFRQQNERFLPAEVARL
ncbi:MAG TPA: hypothetical protein VGA56_11685, partial [Opitutaceae bacterium]